MPDTPSDRPPLDLPEVVVMRLDAITVDDAIQPRFRTNPATVAEYAEKARGMAADRRKRRFPPLVVYRVVTPGGVKYLLSEGFHRYRAFSRARVVEWECEVRVGTRRDALINACASNGDHGLAYGNADKNRIAGIYLAECPDWTDTQIAKASLVSQAFVSGLRRRLKARAAAAAASPAPTPPVPAPTPPEPAPDATPPDVVEPVESVEPDEPPGKVAVEVSPVECRKMVAAMIQNLKKVQGMLSALAAGCYAPDVHESAAGSMAGELVDTGTLLGVRRHGSVRFGYAKYTTRPLDELFSLCGSLKLFFDAARSRTVEASVRDTPPWELGQELKPDDIEF